VIARAAPSLSALAALDAPVGGEASLDLDANLGWRDARVSLRAGTGRAQIGGTDVPLLDAALVATGTPDAIVLQTLSVNLPGIADGSPSMIAAHGALRFQPGQASADLSVELNQVNFADLPRFWPQDVATGARRWLVANIPVGVARNGHAD